MSEWYEASDKDIEIDEKSGDFNVFVCSDDCGNIYVTLSWDQVDMMYHQIGKVEPIEEPEG